MAWPLFDHAPHRPVRLDADDGRLPGGPRREKVAPSTDAYDEHARKLVCIGYDGGRHGGFDNDCVVSHPVP